MPTFDIHPRSDTLTTSLPNNGQASPTVTVTLHAEETQVAQKASNLLTPGIIGAITVVSVLVAICAVVAATLHLSWCMNPRCGVCRVLRCGRRKLQNGRAWDERLSNVPTFTTRTFDSIPDSPEKGRYNTFDRSPLDRCFRTNNEGCSTLTTRPRLQEVSDNKPRYFSANSIVSNVALITTQPAAAASSIVSTSPELAAQPDFGQEPVESFAEDETNPPSAFNPADFNRTRSRASQASGLLSIITLPSFIANDRPRTYSSSAGVEMESPVRPHNHHRKRSSIFGQRLSGTGSVPPVSPVNDEVAGGKRSRPASGAIQVITSALRRNGSASSSVRSSSPSSRRSSRRSLSRPNLSLGAEDEAAIEWKRLPPLPTTQGNRPTPSSQSRRMSGVEDLSTELLSSRRENELNSPVFLPAHVPLPPSPSTLASSVSPLTYASPPSEEIPSTNSLTTPYPSYPHLSHPIPSAPGPLSYPPTPRSTNRSMEAHTVRVGDRTVSPAISALGRLPGDADRAHLNLNTQTAATLSASPGHNARLLPYGPDNDGTERSIRRDSPVSLYSRYSDIQELVLLPPPSLAASSSPTPPSSPRGPRPLPTPGQLGRSGTPHSQTSSASQ